MVARLIVMALFFAPAAPAVASAQLSPPREVANARDRAMVPYRAGFEHMEAEAFEEATRSFQSAVDIDPQFELAFYMLGRSYMAQRRYGEAISALTRARALYQAEAGRQFTNRVEAQRYRRDRILEMDEMIRQYRSRPQTQQTAEILRQLTERRKVMEEDLTRGGNNLSIHNTVPAFVSLSLGSAHFRTENLADAEREYKAAIAADTKAGEAHNNLAVVYLMTGRPESAEKEVKAAEKAGFRVAPQLKDDIKAAMTKKAGTL